MPHTRTPLRRAAQYPEVIAIQTALVYDRPLPEERGIRADAQIWAWRRDSTAYRGAMSGSELWASRRDEVLGYWVEAHPGTRPSGWWCFEAPCLRQRIRGVGEPWQVRDTAYGVPTTWNIGRHQNLWANPPPAPDPSNPPTCESEATFLDRHGLLLPGERDRLADDDFRPQSIFDILDFGEDQ
jgi:hypothetical protein